MVSSLTTSLKKWIGVNLKFVSDNVRFRCTSLDVAAK